jgi:hypothetical protein
MSFTFLTGESVVLDLLGEVVWLLLVWLSSTLYDNHCLSFLVVWEHLTFVTPKSSFMSSYFESLARNQF